ncbi:MAG: Mur ligase domain-containing protein, partial [Bacteroidales bacterium]|nr:Mur ligase domain-containing protein [Bacteroidales bacterium]
MNIIEQIYSRFKVCKKISTDSRIISPNSIFFALKGDNFDGNKYVKDALAKGSTAAVTSDNSFKGMDNVFIVPDTLKTLQDLANYHRKQLNIPIIGITGSNGKTTTKELLASVLA